MRRLSCLLVAWLPAVAAAFQPLITDDTGTQGRGGNQLELAYTRSTEKEPGLRNVTASLQPVYTRGWSEALDFYFGGAQVRHAPATPEGPRHGAGNTVAGLKWRFHEDNKSGLSFAVKPEIRLPVSGHAEDWGLGNGRTNAAISLLLTQETGFGAIHANFGVASAHFDLQANRDIHRDRLWRLSVAPVFELGEHWRIAFDAGLVTNPHREERSRMGYLEAGAIYAVNKDLDLAAGVIRDVGHQGHRVLQLTAGVTWRFR